MSREQVKDFSPRAARGTSTHTTGIAGMVFEMGSMRNRSNQRKPGKPVYFHERPEGRPMADQLGNGSNFARTEGMAGSTQGSGKEQSAQLFYGMRRNYPPTYFRSAIGMKLWSWENA